MVVVLKAILRGDLSGHLLEYQNSGIGGCLTQSVTVVGAIRLELVYGVLLYSIT